MVVNRREAMQALVAIPAVQSIARIEPKPDEVLVVECDGYVSDEVYAHIKRRLAEVFPHQQVLVLGPELRLKVVKASA